MLKTAHVKDYQGLFERCALDLGPASAGQRALPTGERKKLAGTGFVGAPGVYDPGIERLIFQDVSTTYSYGYDADDELTSAASSNTAIPSETDQYDPAGNRTSNTVGSASGQMASFQTSPGQTIHLDASLAQR